MKHLRYAIVAVAAVVLIGSIATDAQARRPRRGPISFIQAGIGRLAATFAAAVHAPTHITGGSDPIQLATNSQPGLMSAAHVTALEAVGAAGPRIYPADADDYLVWELQDTSGGAVNSGTASSANLTLNNPVASFSYDVGGPFGRAMRFPWRGDTNNATSLYGATAAVPSTTTVTLSAWIKVHTLSGHGMIIGKGYAASTWNSPYVGLDLYLYTNNGLRASFSDGGAAASVTASVEEGYVYVGEGWVHVGVTYDGSTFYLYKNGKAVGSLSRSGVLDWGSGGYWFLGGAYTSGGYYNHGFGGYMRGARVANVARPQSWFKAVYAYGIGEAD